MKKYIAEVLGTFALTLAVSLSLSSSSFPVPTPIIAALTLGLFVYSIGHISGCHINPAVTLGAWSIKKINTKDALIYIVCQFVGAAVALWLVGMFGKILIASGTNLVQVGIAEALGTFFFTFGIASVVYEKTPSVFSGMVVGGSLFLGIVVAALLGSNGVLNPAVAFGINSFSLMYVLGPIVGSIAGMQAYKYLKV